MNNLSSYCGIVDAKIRGSKKDLPVHTTIFSFFLEFAWTGFKRALTFEDLHDLPPSIKSCNVVPPFLRNFFVRKNRFETDSVKLNGAGEDIKIVKSSNETQTSGVFRSILKTYGMNFLAAMVLKLIVDVLTFIPPIFLKVS